MKEMEFLEKDCTDYELCSKCGGRCCKNSGCHFIPSDFEKMEYDYLKKLIEDTGYISVAAVGSIMGLVLPIQILYLKIRNVDSDICNYSDKGTCMLLTSNGCSLSFEERPTGAKALIPNAEGCFSKVSELEVLMAWKPYQELLKKLWYTFSDKPV